MAILYANASLILEPSRHGPPTAILPAEEDRLRGKGGLANGMLRHARLAAVGGFAEEDTGGAVFRVALELVCDVGRR